MVRAMTFKLQSALIASLSVAALMLTTSEVFARPSGSRFGSAPHMSGHRPFVHGFRNHRGAFGPIYWPGETDDGSAYAQAPAGVAQPTSHDVHYTYTYDVPWDWAHRLPPQVAPSDRAYVPSCQVDNVVVPGSKGGEHTVNVTRCY
jgi:hypothetical protein